MSRKGQKKIVKLTFSFWFGPPCPVAGGDGALSPWSPVSPESGVLADSGQLTQGFGL